MRTPFLLLALTLTLFSFSQQSVRLGTRFYDVLNTPEEITPILLGEVNFKAHQVYLGLGGTNQQTDLDRESRTVFVFGFNQNPIDSVMEINPIRQRSYTVIAGYAHRVTLNEQWNLLPGAEFIYQNNRFFQKGSGRMVQNAPPNQFTTVFSFDNELIEETMGIRPTLMVERIITPVISVRFGTQISFALMTTKLDQNSEQEQTSGSNPPNTTTLFRKQKTNEFHSNFSPMLIAGFSIGLQGAGR
jgi:hypothetical protein